MNHPTKKMHRTEKQIIALRKKIVAAIEKEAPLKTLGSSVHVSESYAYSIAKRLGYAQMMVSNEERQMVREWRGSKRLTAKAA